MPTRIVEWSALDGTRLAATVHDPDSSAGDAADLPVLCLPGLTRNGRDFAVLAAALAGDPVRPRRVIAVDFRGRGLSGWADPTTYRPDVEATDVIAGLDALGIAKAAVIGTSRGGIVTMVLAAAAGERIGPVVLNDIGPVIERAGLVAIRDRMHLMLGAPPAGDWAEAVAALRATMGSAFTALSDDDWTAVARQLMRADAGGRPVLDYDPRLFDAFADFDPAVGIAPFWPAYEALDGRPLLVIRGENSDLLSEETVDEMLARLPHTDIWTVPGEGHAPLLRDFPTIAAIRAFLDGATVPAPPVGAVTP